MMVTVGNHRTIEVHALNSGGVAATRMMSHPGITEKDDI
jgi:hypothetical protein